MRHHGVSLMEVLFSIGVVAIGLLGVIAVFPLGLNQIGQGQVADMSFRLGQDATQEFEIRGYGQPGRWRRANGNAFVINPSNALDPRNTVTGYAIDPRFVARSGVTVSNGVDTTVFPYWDTAGSGSMTAVGGPRMTRITLATESLPGTFRTMSSAEADAVFMLNDEIAFDLPDDKLLPPVQQFGNTVSPQKIKRQSEGSLSWMATIAPKIDATGSFRDQYLLSIVVFNRRDPTFMLFEDGNGNNRFDDGEVRNERIVDVSRLYAQGFGGGDVELRSPTAADLNVATGDWLMLTKFLGGTPIFRWYRVVDAERELRDNSATTSPPTIFYQDVTVQGGDWPDDGVPSTGPRPPVSITKAVLLDNVVAVYERTIRLETSGMFTN